MIDAHVHLWRIGRHACGWPTPELPALYRDFTLDDLRGATAGTGVDRVILVQSQEDEADSRWLLSLGRTEPRVAGVVGWTDLAAADLAPRLDALLAAGPLVGIRPMVQDLADDWYDDPALDAGFALLVDRGLVLDGLVRPRHLPSLARLARRHPRLAIVVDHCAKPTGGIASAAWRGSMERLAAMPRVACKLSGLLTEWTGGGEATAILPCLHDVVAMFGADRVIWGSDWPVLTIRHNYADWLALARGAVPPAAHDAVFRDNARRLYGLGPAAERAA